MKKLMIVILIIQILIMPIEVKAYKQESDLELKFPLTAKDKYQYTLVVRGNGEVIEGNKGLRNGKTIYSLSVGQSKNFKIVPDIGYEIDYIKYAGKKQKVKERFSFKAVSENRKIEVVFKKKEGIAGISNNNTTAMSKPDTNRNASQTIKTGAGSNYYQEVMIISMIMLMILKRRK